MRGIDYSQGLRYARYEWLESSGGSIFGVVGNLLIPLSYVGIFILITQSQRIQEHKYWLIFAILVGVFGHAALNGGRSNLLLALVMILSALILRYKSVSLNVFSFKNVIPVGVGILSFYYVAYIIESNAQMGGATLAELTELGITALYGVPGSHFFSSEHSPLTYTLTYIFSYLYHGQWTAQIAFDLTDRMGFYSLASLPTVMLNSVGLIDLELELQAFSETGAFISLPGAFYYDFGWPGVFMSTIILGFLLGLVMVFINSSGRLGVAKIVFIISILYILILSPILPAYGLSYFFFILWAFFLLAFLNVLFFRKKIYFV